MQEFTAKIIDPIGLHARPASIIVQLSSTLPDDAKIIYGDNEANLKSIIAIMSLGVKSGATIKIQVTGDTEKESIKKIQSAMKKEKLI